MSRSLRPRRQGPPADHSYSACIPGVPVYDLQVTPIVTGLTLPCLDTGQFVEKKLEFSPSSDGGDCISLNVVTEVIIKDEKALADTEDKTVRPVVNVASKIPNVIASGKKKKRRRKAFYDFSLHPRKRRRSSLYSPPASSSKASSSVTSGASLMDGRPSVYNEANPRFSVYVEDGVRNVKIPDLTPAEGCATSEFISDEPLNFVIAEHGESPSKDCRRSAKGKDCCTACGKHWGRKGTTEEPGDRRQSERIYMKNYKLPFSELPTECKMMILSFLTPGERAMTATVCKEWEQLIKLSSMWTHVDLTIFNIGPLHHNRLMPFHRQLICKYNEQHDRTVKYIEYLIALRPIMKSLKFKFDINCHREDWLNRVTALLESSRKSGCDDIPQKSSIMLTKLVSDWTVTPMEPPTEQFCCIFNKIRTMFRRHLQRIKVFQNFLLTITTVAPKLEHVQFPFDWSPRSVLLLSRLKNISVLKLGKYLNPQGLSQLNIDVLLRNLPELKHLELAICMPVYSNRTLYRFTHPRLQLLDIAYCQGVFVRSLELPELTHLKLMRQYWRGRLVGASANVIPCLYDVLCRGTPKMLRINKHRLPSFWTEFLYDELDHLLRRICSCKGHLYRTSY